jgi:hypothetical protein
VGWCFFGVHLVVFDTSHTHCYRSPSYCPCVPGQGGGGTTRSCFPQRLVCLALSGCSGFAWGGRLTWWLPQGTGSCAKTSLWCKRSSSCWRVSGRRWKLSYIGTSTGVLGLLIQVWIVFIATLKSAGIESLTGRRVVLLELVVLCRLSPGPSW